MKGSAFRDFAQGLAMQIVDQLACEFENEVSQWSAETSRLRSELSKAAELMRTCIGREKQLHDMLEELTGQQPTKLSTGHDTPANAGELHSGSARMLSAERSLSAPLVYAAPTAPGCPPLISSRHAHGVSQMHYAQAKQLLDSIADLENEVNRISFVLATPPQFVDSNARLRTCSSSIVAAAPAQLPFQFGTSPALVRPPRSVSVTAGGRSFRASAPATPYPEVVFSTLAEGPRIAVQRSISPCHAVPVLVPVMHPDGNVTQPAPIMHCPTPKTVMSVAH